MWISPVFRTTLELPLRDWKLNGSRGLAGDASLDWDYACAKLLGGDFLWLEALLLTFRVPADSLGNGNFHPLGR